MHYARKFFQIAFLLIATASATMVDARAQIYSDAELEAEAVRLRNATFKIYSIGIRPSLTEEEVRAVSNFEFSFPMPQPMDPLMDFAATTDGSAIIMPIMSLKALEDMATAFAWLHYNNYSLSTLDLYFTMLRYRKPADFPGGKFPTIFEALGVPPDAYKTDKRVDELSLRLRNETYAFIIAHELGHILHGHKPLSEITAQQAQADEVEADDFALDIMLRTNTPPMGPVIFFQAQIYNLLHPVEFGRTEKERSSVLLQMTHPLTLERVEKLNAFIQGPFARARPDETEIWSTLGLEHIIPLMQDNELAACIIKVAKEADVGILKPRRGVEADAMMRICRTGP